MYVIVRGRVRKQSHPVLSEPAEILKLGPGESVGELGVLDLTPWPESVTAVEETDVIELSALMLAENVARKDLDPIDEANAYRIRIERLGWTV
jgi:CRP-like cAMP-binding protein